VVLSKPRASVSVEYMTLKASYTDNQFNVDHLLLPKHNCKSEKSIFHIIMDCLREKTAYGVFGRKT
jgi:hypothetical protein